MRWDGPQRDRTRFFPLPLPLPLPLPPPLRCCTPFAHEKLDVYNLAPDFLVLADDVIEHLPRGRGHRSDQLSRAAISIVLNIAEGAGKISKPDKRRYYLMAAGSTTECAAALDVCRRLKLVLEDKHSAGKAMLERIAAMLVKLAKSQEAGAGAGAGAGAEGGEREQTG